MDHPVDVMPLLTVAQSSRMSAAKRPCLAAAGTLPIEAQPLSCAVGKSGSTPSGPSGGTGVENMKNYLKLEKFYIYGFKL